MSELKRIIELDRDTRKLYSHFDYKYFLDHLLDQRELTVDQKPEIFSAYKEELALIKRQIKSNKQQALFYLDGDIRKCHAGGLLPSLFNLTRGKMSGHFMLPDEIGKTWAQFEIWSKYEKRKLLKENFWDVVIKIGAILGFVAASVQVLQAIRN